MQIKTTASLYGISQFHSPKTDRDYTTASLIIDGAAAAHFVGDKDKKTIMDSPAVARFYENKRMPTQVTAVFDLVFTDTGVRVNLKALE